jgi:hypothetical protein
MVKDNKDVELLIEQAVQEEEVQVVQTTEEQEVPEKEQPATVDEGKKKKLEETIQKLKETTSEEDPKPSQQLTLRKILGGDLLTTQLVRSQIWFFLLLVGYTIIYVAFRYQCQQDMININKLEETLKDAKFRALASSSTLTEKCRESHVLDVLKQNKDSLLHQADQPPFIIQVPE